MTTAPKFPKMAESVPFGGHLDALSDLYVNWVRENGLSENGDAVELLMSDVTAKQREWLYAFVILWDAEQARLDAKESGQ